MSLSANYPAIRPSLLLDFINAPVLSPRVTFTRASSATYFDQLGVLQTASNDVPRFDFDPSTLQPRGLLIEEQRTNSIRNNTMQGAVAGTPGTLPTNWGSVANGLTQEIVGTGTVNGITYIDIKFSGTTTGANTSITFEGTGVVTASTGQNWNLNSWISVIAGSTANITAVRLIVGERSTVYLTSQNGPDIRTSLSSVLQRFNFTATLANAATTNIQPIFRFTSATGAAIDITLRIGLPQLEQGAFATSVIPTTTAAATRSADTASMTGANFSSWYNASEGTIYWAGSGVDAFGRVMLSISDNTVNNRIRMVWTASNASAINTEITTGNVFQGSVPSAVSTITTGQQYKLSFAYKTDDLAGSRDGGAAGTDTSALIPAVDRMYIGAGPTGAFEFFCGHIRRIAYYPSRLTNAQLQALTAS